MTVLIPDHFQSMIAKNYFKLFANQKSDYTKSLTQYHFAVPLNLWILWSTERIQSLEDHDKLIT